jgi:uncharacterized protein
MSAKTYSQLTFTLTALIVAFANSAPQAQVAEPSFDCQKAKAPDEHIICNDRRLAELDQAVAIASHQAAEGSGNVAREVVRETLAARHSCGEDSLCILDQQVKAVDALVDLGSKVSIPPWVGTYRVDLFNERRDPPTQTLPEQVGQCTVTKIAAISTRFGEELKSPADETNSSVTFANQGYQVSYTYVAAIADSHIGDEILLCLVSLPRNCPPGDTRGKFYSATNLKTTGSWLLPDAQHMCGGA